MTEDAAVWIKMKFTQSSQNGPECHIIWELVGKASRKALGLLSYHMQLNRVLRWFSEQWSLRDPALQGSKVTVKAPKRYIRSRRVPSVLKSFIHCLFPRMHTRTLSGRMLWARSPLKTLHTHTYTTNVVRQEQRAKLKIIEPIILPFNMPAIFF